VNPRDARPAESEEAAEDHEEDECEVKDEDEIGESAKPHQRKA
jgi:hypothetical protein